ncbi:hypothetical protein DK926_13755 [Rhodococcus sp. Eu-32]|uniref:hypothetical protein n=1 Tax=Rhodococcus sp. Eu-32 TaxID=1017319 RepID=UPI000DF4784D|nr:hypothetical protein [Rhodococcus sp. Eu-32]RRQ27183.1 hypothetical protein DK926_13755 [Rhodococcus sp. Eu-32]
MTITTEATSRSTHEVELRRLYLGRFAFALLWAASLILAGGSSGPALTLLLVVYPLVDAAAVLWQVRNRHNGQGARIAQWINVLVSVVVAVALGWASTVSIATVLVVWGIWAVGSGLPQLVTAVRNRHRGGQVPQMLSGGISILAGGGFLAQGVQGASEIGGVAGYAVLGGIFFLLSGIRLGLFARRTAP